MKLELYILFALLTIAFSANAQDVIYWSGYSANGNWDWGNGCTTSAGGNWHWNTSEIGDRSRPDCDASFNKIYFDNGANTLMNLNSLTDFSANQIVFKTETPDRAINTDASRSIYFQNNNGNCKIENYAEGTTHTFNVPIFVNSGSNHMEINPVYGFLNFTNTITNNSSNPVSIYGFQQVNFSGDIAGTAGVTINNAATVVYSGTSKTYAGTTTINTGTKLKISSNQTLGNIMLDGGTLQIDSGATLTITGTYTAKGGTIDNKGTIKFAGGSVIFPGNANVNNGVENTLANIEAAASTNLILNKSLDVTGTIFVSDNAIFDTSNHSVGGTGTNLTMTGTSKYKTRGYGSKPDASGNYLLAPATTIEFYGTSATDIRYGAPIYYANIIVNGSNVSNAGTANGIRFQTAGTFVVKNGATFNINTAAGFTGGKDTGINTIANGGPIITLETGSTIEYAKTGTNGNQTITPFFPAYSNLAISGSGIKKATATTINIANDLNIKAAQLTIQPLQTFEVKNNLMVNSGATLKVEDKGSLVMINDSGIVTNNGTTNIHRKTSPFEPYDYTYWSTPVVSTDIETTFTTPYSFPTDWHIENSYEFVPANYIDADGDGFDDDHNDWSFVSNMTMTPGKGYIIMVPYRPIPFPLDTQSEVIFSGKVNNGDVKTLIALTPAVDPVVADDDFNLVGNPYPSAISADAFINANISTNGTLHNTIEGTLYFWTHKKDLSSNNLGPDTYNYSQDDYAVYTLAGGTGTSGTVAGAIEDTTNRPNGYIASGQGFFVEAVNPGTLLFNNAMRIGLPSSANSQFYKSGPGKSKMVSKDRIWLNLENSLGMFSQQLVGYFDNTTLGYDNGYDGLLSNAGNYIDFYSFIDNKTYKIQGRAAYDENDQVRLGYFSAVAGTFNINIDSKEGVFTNLSTPVYLEDRLLNVIYDLKQSPYTFSTEKGTFNDRFILRYTNKTLETNDFEILENPVLVSNKNKQIKVNSAIETIDKVLVYDHSGRQLFKKEKVNSNELSIPNLNSSHQSLLVKVTLQNGKTVTRKIIY